MAGRANPLVFPAAARHTATVIFAHGLGDSGHGWAMAVENWRRRQRLDEVKFILPHAPSIPITVNFGHRMPGWYDIAALGQDRAAMLANEDQAGILRSTEYFHQLIKAEIDAGIPADRIVLGGFSQGGAMSLFAGLTAKVRLAGIVALSSYLVLSLKFPDLVPKPELNKETPVLMCHGDSDLVVDVQLGKDSFDTLKRLGYNAELKIYPDLGHSATPEELNDIEEFLLKRIPALDKQDAGKSEL
ncbi:Phospholipase/carboxylesterase [Thozetella sp. PMI_491]|nr:Phospholipase/carboxylesterase [Thozetella sp. PMI_491]